MKQHVVRSLAGRLLALGMTITASESAIAQCSNFWVTFYGWPDNDPPGPSIAYPQIHDQAGGTGTYDDPVTFAVARGQLAPGTRIYVPYLQKYFIMEDLCATCRWPQVDLWVGGDADSDPNAVLRCEDSLTRCAEVIVNPDQDLPVVTQPLFDSTTGVCYRP